MKWRNTGIARRLGSKGPGRRGVALVLAICVLALLMAFLIAAQTAVMGSISLIGQSQRRMATSRQVDEALVRAFQALRTSEEPRGTLQVAGDGESRIQVAYEKLEAGAGAYGALPGIEGHRGGDALIDITLEEGAPLRRYLVNLQGRRTGALRIQ